MTTNAPIAPYWRRTAEGSPVATRAHRACPLSCRTGDTVRDWESNGGRLGSGRVLRDVGQWAYGASRCPRNGANRPGAGQPEPEEGLTWARLPVAQTRRLQL